MVMVMMRMRMMMIISVRLDSAEKHYLRVCIFFFFFFFFFLKHVSTLKNTSSGSRALFTGFKNLFFSNFFIKN